MKTKAAVVYEPGKRIEIEELDLDGPREGGFLSATPMRACATPTSTSRTAISRRGCRWCSVTRARGSSRRSGRA